MRTFEEVDDMLLPEYHLLMKAYTLTKLDRERDIWLNAFATNVATGTKQVGKKTVALYPKFKDLFDYDKYEKEILGTKEVKVDKNARMKRMILEANKEGG